MSCIENRKKWVEALRSGKYEQCAGSLHDEVGYCCLGVACEVYQKEVGDLDVRIHANTNSQFYGCTMYDAEISTLPDRVADWLNVNDIGSLKEKFGCCSSLTQLNDALKLSFNKIADVIESDNLMPKGKDEPNEYE